MFAIVLACLASSGVQAGGDKSAKTTVSINEMIINSIKQPFQKQPFFPKLTQPKLDYHPPCEH